MVFPPKQTQFCITWIGFSSPPTCMVSITAVLELCSLSSVFFLIMPPRLVFLILQLENWNKQSVGSGPTILHELFCIGFKWVSLKYNLKLYCSLINMLLCLEYNATLSILFLIHFINISVLFTLAIAARCWLYEHFAALWELHMQYARVRWGEELQAHLGPTLLSRRARLMWGAAEAGQSLGSEPPSARPGCATRTADPWLPLCWSFHRGRVTI